jgi:hypothetical protein
MVRTGEKIRKGAHKLKEDVRREAHKAGNRMKRDRSP